MKNQQYGHGHILRVHSGSKLGLVNSSCDLDIQGSRQGISFALNLSSQMKLESISPRSSSHSSVVFWFSNCPRNWYRALLGAWDTLCQPVLRATQQIQPNLLSFSSVTLWVWNAAWYLSSLLRGSKHCCSTFFTAVHVHGMQSAYDLSTRPSTTLIWHCQSLCLLQPCS